MTSLIAAISVIRSGVGIVQHQAIRHVAYSPFLTVLLIETVKMSCATILLTRALHKERQSSGLHATTSAYTQLPAEDYDVNSLTDGPASEKVSLISSSEQFELDSERLEPQTKPRTLYHHVLSQIFAPQGLRLLVPALLYVAQNSLCLVGATELDPAFFQALWQMRLLVSAVLSRLVLKRQIRRLQWLCIFGIFCGVLCVKFATMGHSHGEGIKIGNKPLSATWLATLQVATAAVLSSVAGITLEYIFRDRTINLWASNVQLSAFSILPAAILVVVSDKHKLSPVLHDLTHSFWPISVVVFHSMNGLLVAVMLKKAGVIVNDLASALAIIMMFVLNSALFPSDNQVKGFGKIAIVCIGLHLGLDNHVSATGRRRQERVAYRACDRRRCAPNKHTRSDAGSSFFIEFEQRLRLSRIATTPNGGKIDWVAITFPHCMYFLQRCTMISSPCSCAFDDLLNERVRYLQAKSLGECRDVTVLSHSVPATNRSCQAVGLLVLRLARRPDRQQATSDHDHGAAEAGTRPSNFGEIQMLERTVLRSRSWLPIADVKVNHDSLAFFGSRPDPKDHLQRRHRHSNLAGQTQVCRSAGRVSFRHAARSM